MEIALYKQTKDMIMRKQSAKVLYICGLTLVTLLFVSPATSGNSTIHRLAPVTPLPSSTTVTITGSGIDASAAGAVSGTRD
jgi:hypothetical protein